MKIDSLKSQLLDEIVACQQSKNVSWYKIAKRANVTQASISRIRHGQQIPSLEMLIKLADACGLEVEITYNVR